MNKLLLLLSSFLISLQINAAPDLTLTNIGTSSIQVTESTFSMAVEINNIGDQNFSGLVRLKPFIIPVVDNEKTISIKPIQFESNLVFVNISAGSSQIVSYFTNELPAVANARYLIGATAFSASTIVNPETIIANNITNQLMDIGTFATTGPSPINTDIDIYSDVRSQINPMNGRASHPWRLSWRGSQSGKIRVIFFNYDPQEKFIYASTYEKGVGWVNMGRDYDELGRLVNYDVYNQGPDFNNTNPGDLYLLTFSNYTENAFEFSHANNIDGRKFHASYISPKPSLEVWKTYVEENPNPFNETVTLNSTYSNTKSWELEFSNLPSQIIPNLVSGTTNPQTQILFTANDWEIDYGVYSYTAHINVKNANNETIESKAINFHISKYLGGTQPVIESSNLVQVSAISPFAPNPVNYTITNSGQLPLDYKIVKNNDWIFFNKYQGSVAPGMTETLTLSFSPVGRDLGNSSGSFIIYNNSVDSNKLINVTYTDNAPANN